MKRNTVKSVFVNKKSNILYYEFFDNEGKRKQKTTTLKANKRNRKRAQQAIPAFEKALRQMAEQEASKQHTFSYYAGLYLEHNRALAKIKTYERRLRKFIDFIGGANVKAADITRVTLKKFFSHLDVSRETKMDYLVPIRASLEYALDDNSITTNVAANFRMPKQKSQTLYSEKVKPFTKEEVIRLLQYSEGDLHNYLGIAFSTGMRPQEIIGLKPSDIDLENKTVHIQRAITKGNLKDTKTHESVRKIPIFESALPYFKDQIARAETKRSSFLFSKPDGSRLDDIEDIRGKQANKAARRSEGPWYKLLTAANVPPRPIRNTRHTFAVTAIESKKFTLQEIAALLGHTSLEPLLKNYAKWIDGNTTKIDRSISLFS